MPIPEYVVRLRRHVGHAPLWLPGVTAVVRREDAILLVRRSDNGEWSPVTGIVDPGEEPATAAAREAAEETGVRITVDRLASVSVDGPVTHVNGDVATYLDHTFACTWVSGDAYPADDESSEVGWFAAGRLPPLRRGLVDRIEDALSGEPACRFRR